MARRSRSIEAHDFDTVQDAINLASSKFGATHVIVELDKMPQAFSPSGGGYLMRELYSQKGRYHWPRQGVRVKKLPEAAKPLVPWDVRRQSIPVVKENPARSKKKKYWEDLPPAEQDRLRALRRQELEAIETMAFPVEGIFLGESVTVLGPVHRFPPYNDSTWKPTLNNNNWLMLSYPDGRKTIVHAQEVHVGMKPLVTPAPSCREVVAFGRTFKEGEADLFGWGGSPYAQENPSQRDFTDQARHELTQRYEASNLAAQGITLGQYINANLMYTIRNIRNRAERANWPEELSWSKENPVVPVTRVMAKKIGNDLRVHWPDVDLEQLRMGIEEEQEHTSDLHKSAQIALDHLREDRHYYTKLKSAGLEAGEARRGPACGPDVQKAGWVHRGGCHPARPICRVARREKGLCHCEAYPHPHRMGGGLCVYGPEGSARFERLVHGPERELEPEPEPEPVPEDEDFGSWVRRNPVIDRAYEGAEVRRRARGVERLDDWYTTKDYGDPFEAPELKAPLVVGVRSSDGEKIITSQIVKAVGTRITTKTGSVYELGRPERGFLEHLRSIGHRFDPRQPIKLPVSRLNGARENPVRRRSSRRSEDAIMLDIYETWSALSPENLTMDGERPAWQARRLGAQLNRKLRALFSELGRRVSEEEAYDFIGKYRERRKQERSTLKKEKHVEIGKKYFYSDFHDQSGAWVKAIRFDEESLVQVEVIEPVGDASRSDYWAPGKIRTVNISNLYMYREEASPAFRFGGRGPANENPADENGIPWVKVERDPKLHEELIEIQHQVGPISGARSVYDLLSPWASKQDQEHLLCVLLDIHSELRGVAIIHKGARDRVSVDPADVLKPAVDRGAKGIVICHNHPSGSAEHSKADADLTKAVRDACDSLDIAFVDHVVLGMGQYYSFGDKKLTRVKSR